MTLGVPLDIVLITSRGSFRVTRQARDLTYRSTSPGGFASCVIPLHRPLKIQPDDVQTYGRVVVTDGRTGQVAWEGYLEDPARSARPDGTVYELVAIGPSGHTKDRTVPLIYVDRRVDAWAVSGVSQRYAETSRRDPDAWQLRVGRGEVWVNGDEAAIKYSAIDQASQQLGRVSASWVAGVTSTAIEVRIVNSNNLNANQTVNTTGGTLVASRGGSPAITAGASIAELRLRRTTSNLTVPDESHWAQFSNIAIRSILKDRNGNDILSGYTANTVLSTEVVNDLLGRLLPLFDGATATVDQTSYGINQLAYPDGVSPHRVLTDLMAIDSAYTWHAWEQTINARHRFEWILWPTVVRYEADVRDGYTSQGSADGLYNRVRVRWRHAGGDIRTTLRTQTVAELTAAGRSREALIDLGDEAGSQTNAERVGDNFLADHAAAPNAGSLRIARPIRDLITGRTIAPWEILPGNLIRVRGVIPRPDALNASTPDGTTVFRIVSTEFRASDAAALLELDTYSRSTARALAEAIPRVQLRRR